MIESKWERILAPTDLSPQAKEAVAYAHSLAEKFGGELHVLHVVHDLSQLASDYGVTGIVEPGAQEGYYDNWLASLLGERGTVRRVEAVRFGTDTAEAIVKYAKKHAVDLIVMATHGRTGLFHRLLGGVAERVLSTTPCPLLVLRPDKQPPHPVA